jgi:N-acyl-L-homoserine lactone synthetase
MNKFAESSAKKKSAIKKKKKISLELLRPLQPDLGTSFVTSLLNDFFPVLADLTELELSAEQEEEAEPELQRPEVAGISNTQRNKLRTSFALAALEIFLQSMKRHRSRAARGKFTGFATTMGDIMKRVGSALERSRSREFAKSVSLVLTQVSRIVNVLYEPSLVRLLEIPFLFQY